MSCFFCRGEQYRRVSTHGRDCGNRISRRETSGCNLYKNLDFKSHFNAICTEAGQKLHAHACISSYMNVEKLRIMANTSTMSQCSYCTLTWVFHDRSVNRKINKIHERALRIAYKDSCTSFKDLFNKAESVSIH